jgi:hypothetical protein
VKKFFSSAWAAIEAAFPLAVYCVGLVTGVLGDMQLALLFIILGVAIAVEEAAKDAAKNARAIRILIVAIAVQVGAARKVEANND